MSRKTRTISRRPMDFKRATVALRSHWLTLLIDTLDFSAGLLTISAVIQFSNKTWDRRGATEQDEVDYIDDELVVAKKHSQAALVLVVISYALTIYRTLHAQSTS